MRIALKNNDLEVCFKELGGELTSIRPCIALKVLGRSLAMGWFARKTLSW